MFNKLYEYLKKPPIYTPSTTDFWNDEYISKKMLAAHLNPDFEGASRKHKFIDKSVEWIWEIAPPERYYKLLDLGCGPGLYTQRLAEKGYKVTGIDYSQRSIDYAKNTADKLGLEIDYLYQNYLSIAYENQFDVIILIYCDFGVLSDEDRITLLQKAYQALKKGGKLIIDVFTPYNYSSRKEGTSWEIHEDAGFWSNEKHICLNGFYKYENDTVLDHTVVITKEKVSAYYLWNHCFTKQSLIDEITKSGFEKYHFYNDVTGQMFTEENATICAVVEK